MPEPAADQQHGEPGLFLSSPSLRQTGAVKVPLETITKVNRPASPHVRGCDENAAVRVISCVEAKIACRVAGPRSPSKRAEVGRLRDHSRPTVRFAYWPAQKFQYWPLDVDPSRSTDVLRSSARDRAANAFPFRNATALDYSDRAPEQVLLAELIEQFRK